MTTPDSDISRILSFWFPPEPDFMRWFNPSTELDEQIKQNFGELVQKARGPSLNHWSAGPPHGPQGTLALLILLDQFTRNIYRGHPDSYATDAKAVDIAVKGIARGDDRKVEIMQQLFFYLPLVHDEKLVSQIAAVALYEGLVGRCEASGDEKVKEFAAVGLGMAKRHRDVIAIFGRFPSRNGVLGRESSEEEARFLKEHPMGF